MTTLQHIGYRFDLPDGSKRVMDFLFDEQDFRLMNALPAEPPAWTELGFCQCANCPLQKTEHPHCPAALHMAATIEELKSLVSYDTVAVTVTQAERTIKVQTSAQNAMVSVLGLIMATAGCPWTDRLRPMARFHLPFASESETVYRSVSMFLLAREFEGDAGEGFDKLRTLYENLHVVNRGIARRLGAASRTDPARNAIAILDTYTTALPAALARSLDELKPLFGAWRNAKTAVI